MCFKVKENGSGTPAQEKLSQKPDVPAKPVERRKSRIFEAAEKFQNLISPTETKSAPVDKPKKILIPGNTHFYTKKIINFPHKF